MVAQLFCDARRAGQGMPQWPGAVPETLDAAYAMQARETALWGEAVGGIKVGRITGADAKRYGVDRFIGPVFASSIMDGRNGEALFPALRGGTALLECEVIAVLGCDAPDHVADAEEMRDLVAQCHIGIEVAGSPVADINALGPLASVACFGNNNGAILGPAIADWRERDWDRLTCTARIDGHTVGEGSPTRLPGGVWAAAMFGVNEAARRGIALRQGAVLCLGALTGMHPVAAGQRVEADFGPLGRLCGRVHILG